MDMEISVNLNLLYKKVLYAFVYCCFVLQYEWKNNQCSQQKVQFQKSWRNRTLNRSKLCLLKRKIHGLKRNEEGFKTFAQYCTSQCNIAKQWLNAREHVSTSVMTDHSVVTCVKLKALKIPKRNFPKGWWCHVG